MALVFSLLVSLSLSQDFYGGFIIWAPADPTGITLPVVIVRINKFVYINQEATCGSISDIENQNQIGSGDLQTTCLSFNVGDGWASGNSTSLLDISSPTSLTLTGCCWPDNIYTVFGQTNSTNFSFPYTIDVTPRTDTNLINSSPSLPLKFVTVLKFKQNCMTPQIVILPVTDADGDFVKCSCQNNTCISGLTLVNDYCAFTFSSSTVGVYVIELLMEDYMTATSTTPLSIASVKLMAVVKTGITDNCYDGTNYAQSDPVELNNVLSNEVTSLDKRLTNLVTNLENNVTSQGTTISGLSSQVNNQGTTISSLSSQVNYQGSMISGLSSQVNNQGTTISSLSSQVNNQGSMISGLSSQVNNQGTTISGLSSQVNNQGTEISYLSNQVTTDISNGLGKTKKQT